MPNSNLIFIMQRPHLESIKFNQSIKRIVERDVYPVVFHLIYYIGT